MFQILREIGRFGKKLICFISLDLKIKAENQTRLGNTKNQTSLIQSFKTILKLSKSDIWLRNYIDFPISAKTFDTG